MALVIPFTVVTFPAFFASCLFHGS
jgi:hypothetical protein